METYAFGFGPRANAPEGQKRFPIFAGAALLLRLVRERDIERQPSASRPPPEALPEQIPASTVSRQHQTVWLALARRATSRRFP